MRSHVVCRRLPWIRGHSIFSYKYVMIAFSRVIFLPEPALESESPRIKREICLSTHKQLGLSFWRDPEEWIQCLRRGTSLLSQSPAGPGSCRQYYTPAHKQPPWLTHLHTLCVESTLSRPASPTPTFTHHTWIVVLSSVFLNLTSGPLCKKAF